MTGHVATARAPIGEPRLPAGQTDTERWLLDAAYFPGGHAETGYLVRNEAELAAVLARHDRVLVVGAQSSLTGGATPDGGAVVATERMDAFEIDPILRVARCQPGVVLSTVQDAAQAHGLFVAPVPTYDGAFVGGAVATNAAGAQTFKYGTMRRAVKGLSVMLADGSVLDLRRGDVRAHVDGYFEIDSGGSGTVRVPLPSYSLPQVPKVSAGYFVAPRMDLVDLFVGSEGTLGIVTSVDLELVPLPPASVVCWLPLDDERRGIEVAGKLRAASIETWTTGDPVGIDVPAIEHVDRRCIELLLETGAAHEHGVPLDADDAMVLLFSVELTTALDADGALDQLAEPDGPDTALRRLMELLGDDAERLEIALPGERRKAAAFHALREAVPTEVNHKVRDARHADERVHKVAGDFVVPFETLPEALAMYREEFAERGLDHAIWGHVSDGNVHPNVIPTGYEDVTRGEEALLVMGERVVALGGSPLGEHGVGRNPIKQAMLRSLYGDEGVAEMRAVKAALDPGRKLAPGVLFPAKDGAA